MRATESPALVLFIIHVQEPSGAFVTNPNPKTAESVAIGQRLLMANCASCHGDQVLGNGPLASTLERPQTNLTASHVDAHPDGDVRWGIANGTEPGMTGFADTLDTEEMWHVVNYVRSLRSPVAGEE